MAQVRQLSTKFVKDEWEKQGSSRLLMIKVAHFMIKPLSPKKGATYFLPVSDQKTVGMYVGLVTEYL